MNPDPTIQQRMDAIRTAAEEFFERWPIQAVGTAKNVPELALARKALAAIRDISRLPNHLRQKG